MILLVYLFIHQTVKISTRNVYHLLIHKLGDQHIKASVCTTFVYIFFLGINQLSTTRHLSEIFSVYIIFLGFSKHIFLLDPY